MILIKYVNPVSPSAVGAARGIEKCTGSRTRYSGFEILSPLTGGCALGQVPFLCLFCKMGMEIKMEPYRAVLRSALINSWRVLIQRKDLIRVSDFCDL